MSIFYRVEFAIDVEADDPVAACRLAWERLSGHDYLKPIGVVTHPDTRKSVMVDLQQLAEESNSVPS